MDSLKLPVSASIHWSTYGCAQFFSLLITTIVSPSFFSCCRMKRFLIEPVFTRRIVFPCSPSLVIPFFPFTFVYVPAPLFFRCRFNSIVNKKNKLFNSSPDLFQKYLDSLVFV